MAAVLDLTELTPSQLKQLEELVITPGVNPKYASSKNFWAKESAEQKRKEATVPCYQICGNKIILPFNLANRLGQRWVNKNLVKPDGSFQFTAHLLPHQVPIAEQAKAILGSQRSVILKLYTSFGKTALAAYLHSQLGGLALILLPSTTLIDQWAKTYQQFTNAIYTIVDPPSSGGFKWIQGSRTIICMESRIDAIPPTFLSAVKILILDESHQLCTRSGTAAMLKPGLQPLYVIACSASFYRKDQAHTLIEEVCGKGNMIALKSDKPFRVYCYNTMIPLKLVERYGQLDWHTYCNAINNNRYRNWAMVQWILQNLYQQVNGQTVRVHKMMILTWHVKHGTLLEIILSKYGIKVDTMMGSKKNYNDSDVLIGTFAKIGTGFDEKMSCDDFDNIRIDVLLMGSSMKDKYLLEQVAGRVFRSEWPSIVYFRDYGFLADSHWKMAQSWFASRKGTVIESNGGFTPQQLYYQWQQVEAYIVSTLPPGLTLNDFGDTELGNLLSDPVEVVKEKKQTNEQQINSMFKQIGPLLG